MVYYKTLEEAQRLQENAAQNGVKFDIEPNPYYRGNAQYQSGIQKQKIGSTNAGSSVGLSQSFPDYRGLPGDEQSLAGAASQFVEHLVNIQPKGSFVKPTLEKLNKKLQEIAQGKRIPAKSFITAMRDVGFLRSREGGSAYLKVNNDSTMRLSNHPATAETFVTVGDRAGNISLVLRSATTGDKDFIVSDRVNLLEPVRSRALLFSSDNSRCRKNGITRLDDPVLYFEMERRITL